MGPQRLKSRLGLNIVSSVAYRLTLTIIPLITTPYIARVFGSETSGVYSYTYTIAQYFIIFGLFGFENYGNRQIAFVRDNPEKLNKTFSALFGLQLCTSVIAVLAYAFYLVFLSKQYTDLLWIWMLGVLSTVINITWLFYGMEQFPRVAMRTLAVRVAGTVSIFLFVKDRQDLWIYCLINALIILLSQAVLWPDARKYVSFVSVGSKDILGHVKGCAILFLPIVLIDIYRMMDKLMLGAMHNMVETGYYNYADKITELPFSVIAAVGVVMIPRMTNMIARGEKQQSMHYINVTFKCNTIAASAITFGMIAVRDDLVLQFLGPNYERCSLLLAILCPMVIVRSWANVIRTQYLMPNRKDRSYITSLCIGVVANLTLNAILIPQHGAAGAAFATLVTESSVASYQIFEGRKELPIGKYILSNSPYLLFGGIMYIVVRMFARYVHGTLLALMLQVLVGAVTYIILVGVFLLVSRKRLQKNKCGNS